MNKIKINTSSIEYASTNKPAAGYVVRIEVVDGKFVARYFKAVEEEEAYGFVINDSIQGLTISSSPAMRRDNTEKHFVRASSVTSNDAVAQKVLFQVGYQVFDPSVGSGSVCGFGERYDFSLFCLPFNHSGKVGEPYNHFAEGEIAKGKVHRVGKLRDSQSVFMFYSDVANAQLSDWTLIYVDTPIFILEDLTSGVWDVQQGEFDSYALLPDIEVSAPSSISPDGAGVFGVAMKRGGQTVPYTGELVLDSVSGYLPKTRLQVSNGIGSFKAMALGLDSGEHLRVKIGTRNVSGVADVSVQIT